MLTYDTIKQLAKEHGMRVTDLIALSPQNDPFYTGRPSEMDAARWFAALWERFCGEQGITQGIHLRRLHYWAVSQETIIMPNGKQYGNTESSWAYLNNSSKYARYLRLVDPAAFVDRRNPEAVINARFNTPSDLYCTDPTPGYEVAGDPGGVFDDDWRNYDLPELPALGELFWRLPDMPDFEVTGYEGVEQPYLIEVWAEKTTQNDILKPLCEQYGANLVTGAGELSITAVIFFLDRARRANRHARILYVSDYDPAGLNMPISVARKVEYYQRAEGFDALDIRLEPVILTAEQVGYYDLPRTPIKDSDLRKDTWEATHGQGATELDALEALHPGEMRRIIEQAILNYYDPSLTNRATQKKHALAHALDELRDGETEPYETDLDEIKGDYAQLLKEFELTRERFAQLIADFQPEIDAYDTELTDIKERKLYAALDAVELDAEREYPLPDPALPEENDTLLYASNRDYLTQLDYYKSYRNGREATR